ncbi:MAG: DUF1127 domain-containing protein [Rhodospirillaceae bacterium]|nr:DUF1127 domain-containing protein [Rhodospirillaceae bacterium]
MLTIDDASHPSGADLHRETRRLRDRETREVFSRGLAYLAACLRGFSEWRQRRAAHAALMRLDDRMLSDIGLNRMDVTHGRVPELRPSALLQTLAPDALAAGNRLRIKDKPRRLAA